MRRSVWIDGWWRAAQACPSPNQGLRPAGMVIDTVVVHSMSLPAGQYGGPEIIQLFTNQLDPEAHPDFQALRGLEVSAHFVIRRNGRLLQFVSCDRRAWHAGRSQWAGRDNLNDFSVGIELEGLEGQTFEACQYQQLLRLLQALRRRYPLQAVLGHEDVSKGRKGDPGPGFDWLFVQRALRWPDRCFPARKLLRWPCIT